MKIKIYVIIILFLNFSEVFCSEKTQFKPLKIACFVIMPHFHLGVNNEPRGILPDLWNLWSKKTGVPVSFYTMNFSEMIKSVQSGEMDLTVGLIRTTKIEDESLDYTLPLYSVYGSLFSHISAAKISKVQELAGVTIGLVKKSPAYNFVKQNQPNAVIREYDTYEEMVQSAVKGEIKYFLMIEGAGKTYLAKYNGVNLFTVSDKPFYTLQVQTGVKKGNSELLNILNNGLLKVSKEEIDQILKNWMGIPADKNASEPKKISIAYVNDFPPISFVNEKQEPTGLIIDLWNLWSKKTGIEINLVPGTIEETINMVQSGKIDSHAFIPSIKPYLEKIDLIYQLIELESNFFFHQTIWGLKGIEDLKGFKIGVVKERYNEKFIQNNLSQSFISIYPNEFELFNSIKKGEIRVFIGLTSGSLYWLNKKKLQNEFHFHFQSPLYFTKAYAAVKKGNVELGKIINKGMKMITIEERADIEKRWLGKSKYDKEIIREIILRWIFITVSISGIIIIFILIWNVRLAKEIQRRKTAEEHLKESEEKYRVLVETANEGVWVIDTNDITTFMNPKMAKMLGYSTDETIGMHMSSFLFQGDIEDHNIKMQYRHKGKKGKYERKFKCKDGTGLWFMVSAAPIFNLDKQVIGSFATISDITIRKQAEKYMIENEERLRMILDTVNAGILTVDPKTFRITYVNPTAESLIGTAHENIIGKKCDEVICDATIDMCPIVHLKKDSDSNEYKLLSLNGKKIPVLKTATHTMMWDKEIIVESFIDLTELRKAEKEKEKLEEKLRQSQKMEAIGTLAGGISHDFNNILSIILGSAEMAITKVSQDTFIYKALNRIITASLRAAEIVKQILNFSKHSAFKLEPIMITSIIEDSLKLLRASLPSTIIINHLIPPLTDVILGNPTNINQVLLNLCINASNAMNQKGVLNINLDKIKIEEKDIKNYQGLQYGEHIQISVIDNGCGIDPAIINRIFEPYFTTKEVGEGSGMGLSVVYGIIQKHKGIVTVYSEKGKGSRFNVYFPIIENKIKIDKKTEKLIQLGNNEKILFIDDEELICSSFEDILTSLGYKSTIFKNPIEAFNKFILDPQAFDLVITDMTMPEMTGDALAIELVKIRSDIPIILCTGYSDKIIDKNINKEIKKILIKPITKRLLAESIREVIES